MGVQLPSPYAMCRPYPAMPRQKPMAFSAYVGINRPVARLDSHRVQEGEVGMRMPNDALLDIMREAYTCSNFGICREAEFNPAMGLIPRGFVGATGRLDEVEAIFVIAEPGGPMDEERYTVGATPDELMREGLAHTYRCFRSSSNPFHRNMRWILDQLWPGSFEAQMDKVWITEGRLCSIKKTTAWFNDRICAPTYLDRQLRLMPKATVVLFGNKAEHRVRHGTSAMSRNPRKVGHVAPPHGMKPEARETWIDLIQHIRSKRQESTS